MAMQDIHIEFDQSSFSEKVYTAILELLISLRFKPGEKISEERFFPGWLAEPDADYVKKIKRRMNDIGLHPELTQYNFCTNGSHYAGEAGISTIGFGPSRENLAHTVDEYIELIELNKALSGYVAILEALLEEKEES